MVLARVRRTHLVSNEDSAVLKRAGQLVSRFDKGDSILSREDTDRQAFGSASASGQDVALLLHVTDENQVSKVRETLKLLVQQQVPSDDDLKQAEAFFVEIGKGVLRSSQTIEGVPPAPGSFRGHV
jgi:septation ring formation regulator EzrA